MAKENELNNEKLEDISGGGWFPEPDANEYEQIDNPKEVDNAVYCPSCGSILKNDSYTEYAGYWSFTCSKCNKKYLKKMFNGPWLVKK